MTQAPKALAPLDKVEIAQVDEAVRSIRNLGGENDLELCRLATESDAGRSRGVCSQDRNRRAHVTGRKAPSNALRKTRGERNPGGERPCRVSASVK
jgi:hypothetical protein